jgi:hypothetical protein
MTGLVGLFIADGVDQCGQVPIVLRHLALTDDQNFIVVAVGVIMNGLGDLPCPPEQYPTGSTLTTIEAGEL